MLDKDFAAGTAKAITPKEQVAPKWGREKEKKQEGTHNNSDDKVNDTSTYKPHCIEYYEYKTHQTDENGKRVR